MIHPNIFKDFGVMVNKYYKVRGVYLCETNQGIKEIYKSNYAPSQITLQHNIKQHLASKGFTNVEQFYLGKSNAPYTTYYNQIFIMNDWHDGFIMDFRDVEDIYDSIKLLAKMHIAGEGFSNIDYDINNINIKNIGKVYNKRYTEAIRLKKRICNVASKTEFEILYLNNVSDYLELQNIAMDIVNVSNYEGLIKLAKQKQTIAHNKYTYHNIKRVNGSHIVLSGFGRSGYGVQLADLVYITRRIMQKNQWDIKLFVNIINEYNKINPLSNKEWDMIKGMIIFPDKFAKLCNKYYNSKRKSNYNMFYRKLGNMLEYKEFQIEFAKGILKL